MIGPRRDRDWFDRSEGRLLKLLGIYSALFSLVCLVLWAVLR